MEKKWEEMSAEERREARFETWLSAEGVEFQSPEAEATYKASITRFKDALLMEKVPDRVPVLYVATFMQPDIYGVTPYECMYDTKKLISAHRKYLVDFKPDYYLPPVFGGKGKIFEILDYQQYKWPGHGVSKKSVYQTIEGEYMLPEDYEALIEDPTDFWLRTYMPRVCAALEPLKNIGAFTDIWELPFISTSMVPFGIPEVQNAFKALLEAGNEAMAWIEEIAAFELEARGMGFPSCAAGASKAPFDILGDTLRGTRAMMIDMYRRPDMILKAVERITPIYVKQGVNSANFQGNPIIFIPLHKGADGFMSDEQFKTFYWPTLKALILGLAAEGCVPWLFCEGSYNTRLEYLTELPKGSCFWIFDRTDMARAKELLGDTLCIGGNVPSGMILTGTAEQVKEYCKNLIDVAGKGGGYIMSMGTAMDEGKADTIKAMIDITKEYGVYK
jgi:hypothetical protein